MKMKPEQNVESIKLKLEKQYEHLKTTVEVYRQLCKQEFLDEIELERMEQIWKEASGRAKIGDSFLINELENVDLENNLGLLPGECWAYDQEKRAFLSEYFLSRALPHGGFTLSIDPKLKEKISRQIREERGDSAYPRVFCG